MKEMEKNADAFIALPGEYFNSLLTLFDKGVQEGFIEKTARDIVILADYADLVNKMEEYAPSHNTIAPRQSCETDNNCAMKGIHST
ncbi:hypothetical protein BVRB_6g145420 isoform A [Beta vulgaris subsp. vulgaris]|nr:hypothetical protein BVRB_6g145420 isoform A [Beta vulgaris subsp. vulgaris]